MVYQRIFSPWCRARSKPKHIIMCKPDVGLLQDMALYCFYMDFSKPAVQYKLGLDPSSLLGS